MSLDIARSGVMRDLATIGLGNLASYQ